jgi:hypothetical protein
MYVIESTRNFFARSRSAVGHDQQYAGTLIEAAQPAQAVHTMEKGLPVPIFTVSFCFFHIDIFSPFKLVIFDAGVLMPIPSKQDKHQVTP